ncbi:V-type ATP synthase subunit E [Candidatus Halobonum tyrrellensis]|uniref:A-type ATP synthase subunit E n=1 Tax=Candidatus Halobonum tyrrellensis G22 TaxID=1324957 RepID=V4HMV7_9EURY|nr:V-type ATP synthase subunit E [Candidatus Halobonum tyrrellensis]ESP89264.1 V-type ATP synthase subunit E [Candidatus Halobonum tyrrellensis G22]
MSLDTVVEDIRDEARARAEEIREEGEARADEIVAEARTEAERIRDERQETVERQIEQEREQTVSSATLEAKQDRLEARRDVLEEVREAVETEVANLEGDRRESLTRSLLDSAAEEFRTVESVSVYGRASDEALLTRVLADYEGWSYAGEHDCFGGVVVESEESRVRVNNTFDSVLDEVWEDNLKQLSDVLFADE